MDLEPVNPIQVNQIYNLVRGSPGPYNGEQVLVKQYYRPGDLAPSGGDGLAIIKIPTVVGQVQKADGSVLCPELIFPACWLV